MFLVFGGQEYYASGGAYDLLGTFEDGQQAWDLAASVIGKNAEWTDSYPEFSVTRKIEWSHILDLKSGKVTAEFGGSPLGSGRVADRVLDDE